MGKLGYLPAVFHGVREARGLQLSPGSWQALRFVPVLQVSSRKSVEVRPAFQLWKTTQSKQRAEMSPNRQQTEEEEIETL